MTKASLTEVQAISSMPLPFSSAGLLDIGRQVPRRAGRRVGAGHREQSDLLAGEIVRCWSSAAGRRAWRWSSGTSGMRSPTWMVMVEVSFGRVDGYDRRAVLRLSRLARRAPAGASSPSDGRTAPFLSGRLLLAMPGMADPRFERAVIAMCVHDENGAVGIGIGHKRAGIRFRALAQAARHRSGRGARLRRPSRRAGRAGPGLRPPIDGLGRAGHASRRRPQRQISR